MQQIKNAQLRKSGGPQKPTGADPQQELLNAIRSGQAQLKKSSTTPRPVTETQVDQAFNTDLLRKLNARRSAIAYDSDDDDDDDDDWEQQKAFTLQFPHVEADMQSFAAVLAIGLGALHIMGK